MEVDQESESEDSIYCVKTFDEFVLQLRSNEIKTGTKYVLVNSPKKFSEKDYQMTTKLKLHWQEDGIPYFHFGTRIYLCHQGKDTNIYQKEKYARLRNIKASADPSAFKYYKAQSTKKLDCPAKISVKRVVKMPEHRLSKQGSIPNQKYRISKLIKKKISECKEFGEECYVFNIPNVEVHKFHLTNITEGMETIDCRASGQFSTNVQFLKFGDLHLRGDKKNNLINECNTSIRSIQSAMRYLDSTKLESLSKTLNNLFSQVSEEILDDSLNCLPLEPPEATRNTKNIDGKLTLQQTKRSSGTDETTANMNNKVYKRLILHCKDIPNRTVLAAADMNNIVYRTLPVHSKKMSSETVESAALVIRAPEVSVGDSGTLEMV